VTGQFLSREPLGENESLNLYSYCHNDPINYVDDLGLAERSFLSQFFFGLDPITIEPSAKEIERRQASMQESFRFMRFLKEFEKGQMDTKEFPFEMKEAFIRQQAELNKLYQQRVIAADLIASGPQIKSIGESPPMVSVAALSIGGATTEFNARINSDWLLPTGAGTAGAKFLFGGMKTMLPILAAGARTEARILTTEMRAGEIAGKTITAIRPYFPVNNGFLGATEKQFLMPGQTIDRFGGSVYSRFFSPSGTSEAARALPAGSAGQPLRSFEVMKPFPVDVGIVAPAFGQTGLGQQFVTPVRLETLLKRGILRESP
jgi:Tuberculosis necrotizing toxin